MASKNMCFLTKMVSTGEQKGWYKNGQLKYKEQ